MVRNLCATFGIIIAIIIVIFIVVIVIIWSVVQTDIWPLCSPHTITTIFTKAGRPAYGEFYGIAWNEPEIKDR